MSLKVGINSLFRHLFTPCSVTALFLTVFVFSSFEKLMASVNGWKTHPRYLGILKSKIHLLFSCLYFIYQINPLVSFSSSISTQDSRSTYSIPSMVLKITQECNWSLLYISDDLLKWNVKKFWRSLFVGYKSPQVPSALEPVWTGQERKQCKVGNSLRKKKSVLIFQFTL